MASRCFAQCRLTMTQSPSHKMFAQLLSDALRLHPAPIRLEPSSHLGLSTLSQSPVPASPKTKAKKGSTTNRKTIKTAGSGPERVAQACDRCRAKKTKCDGKLPACSGCAAVGIKCIVSDKLSRRAYPKGYTETLEERIRQLEAENKRLTGLVDLRDEQLKTFNSSVSTDEVRNISASPVDHDVSPVHSHTHGDSCPCGCSTNPDSVHERPVSIALSMTDDDHGPLSIANSLNLSDEDETNSLLSTDDELISNSLGSILLQRNKLYSNRFSSGENPAPGAFAAATAIEKMQKGLASKSVLNHQQMLTALVAASIPRSTEETLFIPTMLATVCQHFGYDSKPAVLAANAIGSLKQNSNEVNDYSQSYDSIDELLLRLIMNRRNTAKLTNQEAAFFLRNLQLPSSRMAMDHLITIYFQEWGNFLPVLNRNNFLTSYEKLTNILETGEVGDSDSSTFAGELIERFGAIMILVFSLSYLSNKHSFFNAASSKKESVEQYVQEFRHYDYLIHEFVKPHCLITGTCSVQSLQILTLALQYFLAIGDVSGCFELRGRVITMAQQLRLHRCPAAVLGVSGNNQDDVNLRNLQQGERRILFWCLYCLDVYSSLNLGVPRLLKDFEVECALPFAGKTTDDDEEENENILIVNNTKLTIVGKVSRFALSIMLYCQVLGSILDSIYSSADYTSGPEATAKRERQLECWRRELPNDLKFEIDTTGFSLKCETNDQLLMYSKQQLSLIFLYFHARILIYLPILSKFGNNHDVTLSAKEKLLRGDADRSHIVSSSTMIQQSSIQILQVLQTCAKQPNSYLLPIPVNIPREHARLALLVAKGSIDYMKGGPLYHNLKTLLLDTIPLLNRESKYEVPGSLAKISAKLLEMALLSLLGIPQNKNPLLHKKKHLTSPIIRQAVNRVPTAVKSNLDKSIVADDLIAELLEDISPDDNVESVLEFDPFKVNLSQQLLINEFAADGSLGLVPFLDSNRDQSDYESDSNLMSFFDTRQLE